MNHIRVLDPLLVNQIAAGEVVERPASVVKELVENAVDAGAHAVTVEIAGGGIDSIRVADDGTGIPCEEVTTSFLPHSTSKIATADDLTRIETLGFRGEALSSIASVAKVEIRTRTRDNESGAIFSVHGGEPRELLPCGCPVGTIVTVEQLFYNTPARLKFLKSIRSETGYVSDYMSRMILARPDVAFRYLNQGKSVYQSPGDGQLQSAIHTVYGRDVLEHLRPLEYDDGYLRITGYVAGEGMPRPNRQQQTFLINGRYIKAPKLAYALERAYSQRLMSGRYPFAVVNLAISSNEIDVNVHPGKLEIRFKAEDRVLRAMTHAARAALGDYVIPQAQWPSLHHPSQPASHSFVPVERGRGEGASPRDLVGELPQTPPSSVSEPPFRTLEASFDWEIAPAPMPQPELTEQATLSGPGASFPAPEPSAAPGSSPDAASFPATEQHTYALGFFFPRPGAASQPSLPAPDPFAASEGFSSRAAVSAPQPPRQGAFGAAPFAIAGVLFDTYWLIQQGEDVFLIDQHAAHERLLYQHFSESVHVDSQQLLLPITTRLTGLEYAIWEQNKEQFSLLGYDIDPFGETTLCIRAVPSVLGKVQDDSFLRAAIDALLRQKPATPLELKRDAIIQASCKHAVKGGDALSREEVQALLDEFAKEGAPLTCPHGRPVMARMHRRDFEKLFKRIV